MIMTKNYHLNYQKIKKKSNYINGIITIAMININ